MISIYSFQNIVIPYQLKDPTTNIIYSLSSDKSKKATNFYFPEYDPFLGFGKIHKGYKLDIISDPYDVTSLKLDKQIRNVLVLNEKLSKEKRFKVENTGLRLRVYLENVQSYTIVYYRSTTHIRYTKTINIIHKGYQIPEDDYISQWISTPADDISSSKNANCLQIFCQPVSAEKSFEFIVGELNVINHTKHEKTIQHQYFQSIASLHQNYPPAYYTFYSNDLEYVKTPIYGIGKYMLPGTINIKKKSLSDKTQEEELLKSLILKSIRIIHSIQKGI